MPALSIGTMHLASPIVLAPMAGVTNIAFRTLCRQIEQDWAHSTSGLYICEMVQARALAERRPSTFQMITFASGEHPRSMQLLATDPDSAYTAARIVADEHLADHIDMNFGCPVPKVTRKGGGAALPYKRNRFAQIISATIAGAEVSNIPVTVKFRIGIDKQHYTYLDAGQIAEECGAVAVTLHARTAAQRYSGTANWSHIARLKEHVQTIPVLGNGDIFYAHDAQSMMKRTGCDGVVIGRGCLGRPWIFAEISAALHHQPLPTSPTLGQVAQIIRRHAELLTETMEEEKACRELRKHIAWYLRGFGVGSELRRSLAMVSTLSELKELLGKLDWSLPFPADAEGPRGRRGTPCKVVLPEQWLESPWEEYPPPQYASACSS